MSENGLEDEGTKKTTEQVRELAEFTAGDLVTVKPRNDGAPYAGKEFEGLPLQVEAPFHTEDDLLPPDQVMDKDSFDETRIVEGQYVANIRYTFQSEYTTVPLKESSLIPWEEYDGPVHLRPHGDRYCYIEDGDECPICRRPVVIVEGRKDSHNHFQTRTCAVCGYEKGTEPS